jgi:general secretion pathway protein G
MVKPDAVRKSSLAIFQLSVDRTWFAQKFLLAIFCFTADYESFSSRFFQGLIDTVLRLVSQIDQMKQNTKPVQASVQVPALVPVRSLVQRRGFTLIEIMVVVVIMGVLAALLVPRLMGRADDARVLAAKQDISTLMQSLKLYRLDNQRFPTTEQGLQALVTRPTVAPLTPNWKTGGYVDRLNKDPWGNPYQYLAPGLHGEVDIFSYGADGKPGGIGVDADIGSWMD